MNVVRRTKDLRALLDIRIGPGAATLPSDVKRIHLDFALKISDGHYGARKIWRTCLPRLKYCNPGVSMTVNRHKDQTGHSLLTIYWATPQDSSSLGASPAVSSTILSSGTSSHETWTKTDIIDMKNKNESEILQKLINVTNAIPRETDAEEAAEVDEVAEDKKRRDAHRQRQLGFNERRKRELAMLEKARGSTG